MTRVYWVEGIVRVSGHAVRVGAYALGDTPELARREFILEAMDHGEGRVRPVDVLVLVTRPRPDVEAIVSDWSAGVLAQARTRDKVNP